MLEHAGTEIKTTVLAMHELPEALLADDWQAPSVALAPHALLQAADNRLWSASFVLAEIGSRAVGVLPLYRRKGAAFPTSLFDPVAVAPQVFPGGIAADRYLLIGGTTELVSGPVTSRRLDPATLGRVKAALVDEGYRRASAAGLVGAALYVRQPELAAYLGSASAPRPHQTVGEVSTLTLADGGWDGYLAALDHKRRSTVKRDRQRLSGLGLAAREVPAGQIALEAAPLVAAVKQRHGHPDHPALAEYRLSEWAASPVGSRLAFAVRDKMGRLLAVSFGCRHRGVLEMYEIGLADDPELRQLVYAEVLVYAPVRLAARTGCREIGLGLGAVTPKRLRGAKVTGVWAVGQYCVPSQDT